MKRTANRSHCPINFALESFGDTWSLLIVRDIVYYGKRTFREFLTSEEAIATNILKSRLAELVSKGILVKSRHPNDKRKEVYTLTEKGLALIPLLVDMAQWSIQFDPHTAAPEGFRAMPLPREQMINLIQSTVGEGGSIFAGSNSVVSKLQTVT